jgi:hypothetical protein
MGRGEPSLQWNVGAGVSIDEWHPAAPDPTRWRRFPMFIRILSIAAVAVLTAGCAHNSGLASATSEHVGQIAPRDVVAPETYRSAGSADGAEGPRVERDVAVASPKRASTVVASATGGHSRPRPPRPIPR